MGRLFYGFSLRACSASLRRPEVLAVRNVRHNSKHRVPFPSEGSAARYGVGLILRAAQLDVVQTFAGALIAHEAEGSFVIECWWRR
jgi:hypothetical protein